MSIILDGTNGIVTPDLDSGPVTGTTANFSGNMTLGSSVLETPVGSAPAYVCRAWVNFDGSTAGIRASGNVSSVTKNGTGDYTVNFTTAMPDANFGAFATSEFQSTANIGSQITTTTQRIVIRNISGSNIDVDFVNVAIFR